MNAWPGSGRAETPRAVTLPLATAMQPPLQPTAPPALGAWRDAVMPVAPAAGQIDRTQTPTQGTDAPRLAPSPAASAVSVRATVQAKPDPGADPGPLRPQVTSVLLPGFSMRVSDPQNLPATGAATGQAVPSTQLALPRQEPLTAAFVAASFPEKPIQARSPGRTVSQLLSPPDPKDHRASTRPATLGPRIEALGNHTGPIIGMRVPAKAEAAHLPGSAPPEHMAQQAPSAPLPLAAAGLLALAMPLITATQPPSQEPQRRLSSGPEPSSHPDAPLSHASRPDAPVSDASRPDAPRSDTSRPGASWPDASRPGARWLDGQRAIPLPSFAAGERSPVPPGATLTADPRGRAPKLAGGGEKMRAGLSAEPSAPAAEQLPVAGTLLPVTMPVTVPMTMPMSRPLDRAAAAPEAPRSNGLKSAIRRDDETEIHPAGRAIAAPFVPDLAASDIAAGAAPPSAEPVREAAEPAAPADAPVFMPQIAAAHPAGAAPPPTSVQPTLPPATTPLEPGPAAILLGSGSVESPLSTTPTTPAAPTPATDRTASVTVSQDASGRIEVQLAPEELGRVRVEMTATGDRMQIHLAVERPESLDLLRRHGEQLLQEFRQAGIAGGSLTFGTWQQGDQHQRPSPATPPPAQVTSLPPDPMPSLATQLRAQPVGSGLNLRL